MKMLKVLKYVGFGILGIAFIFLTIYLVMCLWNWLIPDLFHGPVITYWQTAGLFLLSKILLTGIAPGSGHGDKSGKDWHSKYREKHKPFCREEKAEPSVQQS